MTQKTLVKTLKESPATIGDAIRKLDPEIIKAVAMHFDREAPEVFSTAKYPNFSLIVGLPDHKENTIPDHYWLIIAGFFDRVDDEGHFRFSKENADRVVENFHSRYLSQGLSLPIRVGFPNCWTPDELSSIPVYGHITDVEVRHDPACRKCRSLHNKEMRCDRHGLLVQINWFKSGAQLLREGMFRHLAIRWNTDLVNDDPVCETWTFTELKRVGLVAESALEN